MLRTQIQLTEEQAGSIKALAAKRGVSIAEVIRQAIDDALRSPSGHSEDQIRRAKAFTAPFGSGVPDLGTEHDRYLAEAYAGTGPSK